jgi:hypothetical protein
MQDRPLAELPLASTKHRDANLLGLDQLGLDQLTSSKKYSRIG